MLIFSKSWVPRVTTSLCLLTCRTSQAVKVEDNTNRFCGVVPRTPSQQTDVFMHAEELRGEFEAASSYSVSQSSWGDPGRLMGCPNPRTNCVTVSQLLSFTHTRSRNAYGKWYQYQLCQITNSHLFFCRSFFFFWSLQAELCLNWTGWSDLSIV